MIYSMGPGNKRQARTSDAITGFMLRFGNDPRYADYRHLSAKYPNMVLIGIDYMAKEAQYDEALLISHLKGHEDIADFLHRYLW